MLKKLEFPENQALKCVEKRCFCVFLKKFAAEENFSGRKTENSGYFLRIFEHFLMKMNIFCSNF